jgi:hypothetical protein
MLLSSSSRMTCQSWLLGLLPLSLSPEDVSVRCKSSTTIAVAVALALAFLGCGEGGESGPHPVADPPDVLTKDAYIAEVEAICSEARAEEPLTLSFDTTEEGLVDARRAGPATVDLTKQIQEIVPPQGDERVISRWLMALRDAATEYKLSAVAVKILGSDSPDTRGAFGLMGGYLRQADQVATSYGIGDECSPDTP